MTNRKLAAKKAWETIRNRYPKGALARKAWETRKLNQILHLSDEEYIAYMEQEMSREYNTAEHKRIRSLIIQAGGVNDPDYQDLPRWCKRKSGYGLDVLVGELSAEGVPVQSAEDLYKLLKEVSA